MMTEPAKSTPEKSDPAMKGWLLKWTNYIKGYQRRWFVLSNGVLSYYRNQSEINHTCRGTISLHGALIHTVDSCTFVISNGGTQTFHIKAANEVERQSWVTALELAKAKAIRAMECEEEEEETTAQVIPSQEINTVIRDLTDRLENLRTCYDLITKHGVALQRALSDLETNEDEALASRTKIVNERATLFRITSNAMINACNDYLRTAESQGHKWSKMLQHEREQRQRLEEMVEQLAKQHTQLEQAAHLVQHHKPSGGGVVKVSSLTTVTSDDDDNEFFDAEETTGLEDSPLAEDEDNAFILKIQKRRKSSQQQTHTSSSSENEDLKNPQQVCVLSGVCAQETRTSSIDSVDHSTQNQNDLKIVPPSHKSPRNSQSNNPNSLRGSNPNLTRGSNPNPTRGSNPNPLRGLNPNTMRGSNTNPHNTNSNNQNPNPNVADPNPNMESSTQNFDNPNTSTESANNPDGIIASSKEIKKRRLRVPDKPNYPLNLWSIMKNCIGKELSKIPMPVNFNEPLSMLQRLTEDYEYAHLLDIAAKCKDECEQLAYVAAFTISSYSTTANRTGKPFNPLLGETFECDRTDDLGWRCIAEQVSHHPPMAAIYCEGREWSCWQEFTMTSKFRGKYLQVIPLGTAYVQFNATGNKYSWRKVTTTVNNIIVGKLWVDQHGDMEITGLNSAAGVKCHLKYIPYSYFSRDQQRRVKGVVMNRNNDVKWVLRGTWDSQIEIASVLSTSGTDESQVYKTASYKPIWIRQMPPPDSDKYYNFTTLACQLNEIEEGVAPTDSRLRPDQRLMEEGKWEDSNRQKIRLEEKQRLKRRTREAEAETAADEGRPYSPYEPVWFTREKEEGSDNVVHVYNGTYWKHKMEQKWSHCPDLF